MKIAGREISAPKESVLVIPRDDGDIVIKAQPILNLDEFDTLYPPPEIPILMKPGGVKISNPEQPEYLEKQTKWAELKTTWMQLKSLEPTKFEWETVDMQDPETWENYMSELSTVFSQVEVVRILQLVIEACGLSQDKIDEATAAFLAGQAQAE